MYYDLQNPYVTWPMGRRRANISTRWEHLDDLGSWSSSRVCVVRPAGVPGPVGAAGGEQGHAGLHHGRQRRVGHHRRPGHHHHVRLGRHAEPRGRRVLRRPQVGTNGDKRRL